MQEGGGCLSRTRSQVWCLFAMLLVCANSHAANLSYRYFEAGYSHTDISLADGNGGYILGRWQLGEHWFVLGQYSENNLRSNQAPSKADFEYVRAGLGYRAAMPGWYRTDWYALISYNEIDLTEFEDESESGEDFELGLKYRWRPGLVVTAAARYFNSNIECIDLLAGEAGYKLGANWNFTRKTGVAISYENIHRFSEWRIGLRKHW